MCIVLSMQVQAVALGWFVYAQTGSALSLGLIGLAQFAPAIPLLTLAGYAADHYDRRKVIMLSQTMQAIGALGLYLCVHYLPTQMLPIYLMAMLIAGARSFSMPSTRIAAAQHRHRASSFRRLSPSHPPRCSSRPWSALRSAAFVYARIAQEIFLLLVALPAMAALLIMTVKAPPMVEQTDKGSAWQKAVAGFSYVRHNQLILGAMSLDLFAVLLGGVTALLPIFAQDILHVGPAGLGILRSGPTFGALLVGIALTQLADQPPRRTQHALVGGRLRPGHHRVRPLDQFLALARRADRDRRRRHGGRGDPPDHDPDETPDAMRGRVSAVNSVFIGASNQLGSFEAGVMASLLGLQHRGGRRRLRHARGGRGHRVLLSGTAKGRPDARHAGERSDRRKRDCRDFGRSRADRRNRAAARTKETRELRDEVRACVPAPEAGRSAGPRLCLGG